MISPECKAANCEDCVEVDPKTGDMCTCSCHEWDDEPHSQGCPCADCSGAELTAEND